MDLTRTIVPKSDQKNADDFLAGPMTFTITSEIEYASTEQPCGLVLDGDDAHPYKPGKSMRRVLVAAWGAETSAYVGRRLTLYTDPTVRFGGQDVGGIRISHMSHIPKTIKLNLTETKGKKKPFVVAPLAERTPAQPAPTQPEPTAAEVDACADVAALRVMWKATLRADLRAQIEARIAELAEFDAQHPPTDEPT